MSISHPARRWGAIVIGCVVLGAGVLCLHYTKPSTLEHHRAWAVERGWPAPNNGIFWGGMGSAMLGAFVAGFGVAGRKGARAA